MRVSTVPTFTATVYVGLKTCTHASQRPIGRRLIEGIERVVFQCQDCLAELIYQEPDEADSSNISARRSVAIAAIQEYVNAVGLCVTITDTEFAYTNGSEPGLAVGLINYPRFPSSPEQIKSRAIAIAEMLLKKCRQMKVSIVMPQETVMISVDEATA